MFLFVDNNAGFLFIKSIIGKIVSLLESVGVTDALTRVHASVRKLADNVGITDTVGRIVSFTRKLVDSVSFTAPVGAMVNFARTVADSVNVTDILSRSAAFFRNISDTNNITDVLSAVLTLLIKLVSIADSIGITDVISRIGTFIRAIAEKIDVGSISSIIATLYGPRKVITNPYGVTDQNLLRAFHRESPDFDLMNSINAELHKVAASYCRLYKLDISQSTKDNDDIYPELEYRTYLPPILVKMYFVTPTWTEELSKFGINIPKKVVFSINLQELITTIRDVKAVASKAKAGLDIEFNWVSGSEEPAIVYFYCDGNKIYSHLRMSDGRIIPDSDFELNIMNQAGTIDLHHPAVNTVEKLTGFINNYTNYMASYSGNGGVLSSKGAVFSGSIGNYDNWIDIKDNDFMLIFDRATGVYDNVSDVVEGGDIIELFRRHEGTRNAVEGDIPIHDPVTLQPVRGGLYEVRYALVNQETPTRHYINYNIIANKVAMDVYDKLLEKLPVDENFAVGSDRWYA